MSIERSVREAAIGSCQRDPENLLLPLVNISIGKIGILYRRHDTNTPNGLATCPDGNVLIKAIVN